MQHSASDRFKELLKRASEVIHTFQEQALAQLLWAFKSLYERAGPILDSLDNIFKNDNQLECSVVEETLNNYDESDGDRNGAVDGSHGSPVLTFTRDQLRNIAWSYAFFGQMGRTFFSHVRRTLSNYEGQRLSEQYEEDVMFNQNKIACAGRTKRFNQKVTSSFQKEVGRLLFSTGLEWVREYVVDGYT